MKQVVVDDDDHARWFRVCRQTTTKLKKKPETYIQSFGLSSEWVWVRVPTFITQHQHQLIIEYFHHVVEYSFFFLLFNINSGPKNARWFLVFSLVAFSALFASSSSSTYYIFFYNINQKNSRVREFKKYIKFYYFPPLLLSSSSSSSSCCLLFLMFASFQLKLFFSL